jgi:hypothetical protein
MNFQISAGGGSRSAQVARADFFSAASFVKKPPEGFEPSHRVMSSVGDRVCMLLALGAGREPRAADFPFFHSIDAARESDKRALVSRGGIEPPFRFEQSAITQI